jgi:Peptidase family S41/N-terminal domain of Peptidase_S41 in eukaryotic IRBP
MPPFPNLARKSHALTVASLTGLFLASIAGLAATSANAEAAATAPRDTAALTETLARELTDYFVFPDVAQRYAAAIRARQAAGAYAAISDPAALAAALTADLQAVAKDGHLRVFAPQPAPAAGPAPGGGPVVVKAPGSAAGQKPGMMMLKMPQAIPATGWLADSAAYIRFDLFPGDPETLKQLRAFITAHAGARALIIDARAHRGGGLEEMDVLYPHLFTQPTELAMMDTRAAVEAAGAAPVKDGPYLLRQPSEAGIVRRLHVAKPADKPLLGDAKVYLLTSRRTGSAGEHLAMTLKRTHRATLIGEPTYGAAHYGGQIDLPGGFWAFVPGGRSYDPDTGKSWEGIGVTPDVTVPAADALNKALELAGVTPAQRRPLAGVS